MDEEQLDVGKVIDGLAASVGQQDLHRDIRRAARDGLEALAAQDTPDGHRAAEVLKNLPENI